MNRLETLFAIKTITEQVNSYHEESDGEEDIYADYNSDESRQVRHLIGQMDLAAGIPEELHCFSMSFFPKKVRVGVATGEIKLLGEFGLRDELEELMALAPRQEVSKIKGKRLVIDPEELVPKKGDSWKPVIVIAKKVGEEG